MVATSQKTQTTLDTLMRDYVIYNLWANKTLTDWLKEKPLELLEREVASSFPSIRKTIAHILNTQKFWLSVIQRQSAPQEASEQQTTHELFDELVDHSLEFSNFVETLTSDEFHETVEFSSPWVESEQPRLEFILHSMNHGTYHRGQIVTIGRNLGFTDAPMTDYNFYVLNAR
jgi:uncharacterized damage-inducible protein DinB